MRNFIIPGIAMLIVACSAEQSTTPTGSTMPAAQISPTPPGPVTSKDTEAQETPAAEPRSLLPPVADIEPATGPQARAPLDEDPPPAKPFHEPGEVTPIPTRRP